MTITNPVGSARLKAYTGTPNTISGNVAPGTVITVSHSAATTLNLPDEATAAYENGTVFFVVQVGAGAVTVAAPGDATVLGTVATVAAGDTLIVSKTGTDAWHSALAT